jgi:sugar lactone lactonase YvrE
MRDLSRLACRVLSGCCFLAVTAFTVHAQSLTFTTLAGTAGGSGSADGAGSAARFNNPIGLALDAAGNVYVADKYNHTIRKVTPAGVVTTFAGAASIAGNSDGAGGVARFRFPFGLATDSAGNVYVGGYVSHTVRKITPAGVVTTLAGLAGDRGSVDGTGILARFSDPLGVATDSGANVYVADRSNHTIRKITPAGVVTTLAGSPGVAGSADGTGGGASFNHPAGVATDSGGNVYVADTDNHTIRKITSAGVVTTLAGSAGSPGGADGTGSAARFDSPELVATDSSGNVYVTEDNAQTIRMITPAAVVTTVAGVRTDLGDTNGSIAGARFYGPAGLAVDRDGNIYLAEYANSTVRKIASSGLVTTLAGSPPAHGSADGTGNGARFNAPWGVATDSGGNVYVPDSNNHTIRKITPAGVVTTIAGSAGLPGSADGAAYAASFNSPRGVATDGSGNVYVADTNNHTIRKITPGGAVMTLAGLPGAPGSADGTGSAASFAFPSAVAVDSGGNVYVTDYSNDTIRKITPGGAVTTLAGLPGSPGSADGTGSAAHFYHPGGVATDSNGNVYVADSDNNTIRKITSAGVVTTLAGGAVFSSPEGVATDSAGNVFVADTLAGVIRKITPAGAVTTLAGLPSNPASADGTGSVARFFFPTGVATDSSGNVYVADFYSNKILVGRPALADAATIDFSSGAAGTTRQLNTSPQTATSWQWRIIRQPSDSTAALSSTSIRNPIFMADVADLYTFQLTASNGVNTRITNVSLTATPLPSRRRAVGHAP